MTILDILKAAAVANATAPIGDGKGREHLDNFIVDSLRRGYEPGAGAARQRGVAITSLQDAADYLLAACKAIEATGPVDLGEPLVDGDSTWSRTYRVTYTVQVDVNDEFFAPEERRDAALAEQFVDRVQLEKPEEIARDSAFHIRFVRQERT